jgi:hypothetical protein
MSNGKTCKGPRTPFYDFVIFDFVLSVFVKGEHIEALKVSVGLHHGSCAPEVGTPNTRR